MVEHNGGYSSKKDKECQLAQSTGSVSASVQKEDVHLHPDLEFKVSMCLSSDMW